MLQRIAVHCDKGRIVRRFANKKFLTAADVLASPERTRYFEDRLHKWTVGWLKLRNQ